MANTFITTPKIIYGEHALETAKSEFERLGEKALIVTTKTLVNLKVVNSLTTILDALNIQYVIFDSINNEPIDKDIENGVQTYNTNHCDFLIALGGGSPIDAMKAIALMSNRKEPISYFNGTSMEFERPPIVAIPTTSGTGSEATQFTIITDTENDIKMLLKGSKVLPDLAIIDPTFTVSVPKGVTAATGIDAFCHAMEAYTSKKAQPMSDIFAKSAVKRILENLYTCYQDPQNISARTNMALASLEAGIAFNNASVTVIHGMSRPIGAIFHVPHGLSNAMLLKTCLSVINEGAQKQFAELAIFCNLANEKDNQQLAANKFINAVYKLLEQLEISTFKEHGIDSEQYHQVISKMSKDAIASGSPANTRKDLSKSEIEELYKKAYM